MRDHDSDQLGALLMSSAAMRLFAGVAVQPFLASACAFFMFPVLLLDEHGETLAGGRPADSTEAALSVALVTGVLALFVGFGGAITAVAWRTRRGFVHLGEALLFGLGFGNLPYVMLAVAAGWPANRRVKPAASNTDMLVATHIRRSLRASR
jgi:hypothetical protein